MAANLHDENFDVHEYLKATLQSHNYEGERARLKDATTSLDRKLQKEVADNFPKLKEQVRVVQDIERKMEVIKSSANHLSQSVNRIKHLLQEPYEQVQSKVQELHNVWGAAEVLRKLSKFLTLVGKVRSAQDRLSKESANLPNLELPNEAKTLRDIEIILHDKGQTLKGIDVVDRETDWIKESIESVKQRSHELLKRGLINTNQAEIRTAVQAFYNFDLMGKVIKKVLSDHAQELRKVVAQELDVQSIISGSGITNEQEQAGKVKTVLFGKIDSTFQRILQHISKLSQLVKVLSNTKDPITQESFMQLLDTENSGCVFTEEVWKPVSVMIGERVPRIVKRFPLVVDEYPRLHYVFRSFVYSALEHFPTSEGLSGATHTDPKLWLDTCLSEPQIKYMNSVKDRLSEKMKIILQRLYSMQPKDNAFGTSSVTPESGKTGRSRSVTAALQAAVAAAQIDIRPLIGAIGHEFSQIRADQQQSLLAAMCELVNSIIQNWVQLMWKEKVSDPSCQQVLQPATNNQLFNSVIALALIRGNQDLKHLVSTMESEDMQSGQAKLLKTISEMEEMADGIINEVFHSCEEHLSGPTMSLPEAATANDVKSAVANTNERWSQVSTNILILYSPAQCSLLEDRFKVLISNVVDVIVKRISLLNVSGIQHTEQTEIAGHIGGLVQIVLDNNTQLQSGKISKSLKTIKALATVLNLTIPELHEALTQTGRLSPVQMELNALPSITMLHCILSRMPSSKPIFSLLSKSPFDYISHLSDEKGLQEAEQTGWNLLKEWGPRATEDMEKLIWECGQAWNQRRIQMKS
eukprot:TRINITY_DN10324_c0_g1_i1.p1 TRINITY_DN10324_c0_g1~~TRINITY_DN10324_c0_g1_i1.p1  ORF type:complete len:808 (+),score=164.33 TRINITY_DN10324_c0_g1_i1:36-2459(+)